LRQRQVGTAAGRSGEQQAGLPRCDAGAHLTLEPSGISITAFSRSGTFSPAGRSCQGCRRSADGIFCGHDGTVDTSGGRSARTGCSGMHAVGLLTFFKHRDGVVATCSPAASAIGERRALAGRGAKGMFPAIVAPPPQGCRGAHRCARARARGPRSLHTASARKGWKTSRLPQ
jgi:hypothetical protein